MLASNGIANEVWRSGPGPYFATASYVPIDLPEQVLTLILSLVHKQAKTPGDHACCGGVSAIPTALRDVMCGIGAVTKGWRRLVGEFRMRDGSAWLRVSGACAAAECLSAFPRAHSLRVDGDARVRDVVTVLASRSVERLSLEHNKSLRHCRGLRHMASLRTLHLNSCCRLSDVRGLSSLAGLCTLDLNGCDQLRDVRALSSLVKLEVLDLGCCHQVSDVHALSALVELHTLSLGGCVELRDVRAVSSLVKLQTLDLRGCYKLSDVRPLSSLVGLQTLDLCCCYQLSDVNSLSALSALSRLQTLKLPAGSCGV
jgi:Leucine-rich repeat (LRR) protein